MIQKHINKKGCKFLNHLFNAEGNSESRDQLKREFSLNDNSFYKSAQLTQYQVILLSISFQTSILIGVLFIYYHD